MSEPREGDGVLRALRILAAQLESFLDGEESALETLEEAFEAGGVGPDDLQSAIWVLRGLSGEEGQPDLDPATAPGRASHRVLSAEERAALSPEAWGFLLGLRRRGSLDPMQFERVLDRLSGTGVRPVDVDQAREMATRVVLQVDDGDGGPPMPPSDLERAH
jgi:uncharacterized protein Smg (DUF494 family)